jgi:Arc/MetJ family transcription regulator
MAKRIVKPIRDVKTGMEYPSQAAAGRALAHLVKGDPKNNFVWYELLKRMPERFRTPNAHGDWVSLDDPSAPVGVLFGRSRSDSGEERSTSTRLTTLEIDDGKYAQVRKILGTTTLRETVDRLFDEEITRDARIRSIAQLRNMDGLDLDKPAVMDKAWR